jgi:oligoribonuclease NrnB/cAMP/cGMP phosphodiesterase (DHH superfamily)
MKIFYHGDDFDGLCSAAIIHLRYPIAQLIPMTYGNNFPWDSIEPDEQVIMVDFSLSMSDMIKLNSLCRFVWIDHHFSAIQAYEEGNTAINGVRINGTAACVLTWRYFFGGSIPRAIVLLGRYDVWDKDEEGIVDFFHLGMEAFPPKNVVPDSFIWKQLFEDDEIVESVIKDGRVISGYQKSFAEKYCKSYAFEKELFGLRAICVNIGMFGSDFFESVYDPNKHDIMVLYCDNPKGRCGVSLRSTKDEVDCSKIAKLFGGGGHKRASGLSVKNIQSFFSAMVTFER